MEILRYYMDIFRCRYCLDSYGYNDIGIYIYICIGYITINGNIGDIPSLMSGCLIGYATTPCLWVNGSMGQAWFSAGVCGELITLRMKGIPMMMGWPLAFDPMMWPWNTDRWFSMAFNNPSFGKNWGDAQKDLNHHVMRIWTTSTCQLPNHDVMVCFSKKSHVF